MVIGTFRTPLLQEGLSSSGVLVGVVVVVVAIVALVEVRCWAPVSERVAIWCWLVLGVGWLAEPEVAQVRCRRHDLIGVG